MNKDQYIKESKLILINHAKVIESLDTDLFHSTIIEISDLIISSLKNGNKIYFCGNGGSAADAQHLAAEFTGRFFIDRKPLPAEALHCNSSYLTAVGNDYGYEFIYSRLIEGIASSGDVLIGLSTSGNSVNIVNAFKAANKKGVLTIGLTGEKDSKMSKFADIVIKSPSKSTPRIQESHILIGHIICEFVEKEIFKNE
tara:strand:- start:130 stop:723 length:594 start_codon:yes stop_codon:yes gene_type:complete